MANVIGRKYDIILFGATGFTGQYVARELARIANSEKISWAIAGRNVEKMRSLLDNVKNVTDQKTTEAVGLIKADVADIDSLNKIAQKGKTILNCVGPYRFYGEAVVRACVKNGTNHIDTSGEPAFLENMQLKFTAEAQKNECYVVGACGFDSIPADMGIVYLQQLFDGQLNSVETFLRINSNNGFHGHYATWQSAIYGFANAKELKPLRKKLFPNLLPELKPKLSYRGLVHRNAIVKSWCLPFPGSDRSVVMRTQRFLHETENKRPVQMTAYVQTSSFFNTLLMAFSSMVFVMMAPFRTGQRLLERYPRFFSFGVFDHAGPSDDELKGTTFTLTLLGKGWSEKSNDGCGNRETKPPNKELIVQVSGPDPGYVATAICVTQAALVLRDEIDRLPPRGGVFTPGAAFAKTTLIERLDEKGIHFRPVLRSQL